MRAETVPRYRGQYVHAAQAALAAMATWYLPSSLPRQVSSYCGNTQEVPSTPRYLGTRTVAAAWVQYR